MKKIKTGVFEGIKIYREKSEVFVEVPKYEKFVMDQFKGKVGDEFYSSFYNNSETHPVDRNTSLLKINPKMLQTEDQIIDFNNRVHAAVDLHKKIKEDFETIQYIVSYDHAEEGKECRFRFGQDRNSQTNELKKWAYGTIVAINDSYVALSSGSNDEAKYFRILPTERFLLDWKEERNAKEILSERLKVGETVKLTWNENRKIEVQPAQENVRAKVNSAELSL